MLEEVEDCRFGPANVLNISSETHGNVPTYKVMTTDAVLRTFPRTQCAVKAGMIALRGDRSGSLAPSSIFVEVQRPRTVVDVHVL